MPFISYSQNLEDVMLRRAFSDIETGFYVDVGANDPCLDSVTKAFYDSGWSGVNIEPDAHYLKRLIAARPRDTNLGVIAGNGDVEMDFFTVAKRGLSTADIKIRHYYDKEGLELYCTKVRQMTLTGIFDQYAKAVVHFLKIDVEGMEKSVLEGMDFTRHRPWVILVEAIDPITRLLTADQWEYMLLGADYEYVYTDGINRFYVSKEKADLKSFFLNPPNIFDNYRQSADNGDNKTKSNQDTGFVQSSTDLEYEMENPTEVKTEQITASREKDSQIHLLNAQLAKAQETLNHALQQLAKSHAQVTQLTASQSLIEAQLQGAKSQIQDEADRRIALCQNLSDAQEMLARRDMQLERLNSRNAKSIETLQQMDAIIEQNSRKIVEQRGEITRLRKLLYSAGVRQHIFRAWRVWRHDPHYCDTTILPEGLSVKEQSNSKAPWNVHLGKAIMSLIRKNTTGKPWHTHIYRAWQSFVKNPKYTVQKQDAPEPAKVILAPKSRKPSSESSTKSPKNGRTALLLSTFPFRNPRHGGQLRLYNIAKIYEANGWRVHSVAVHEMKVGAADIGPNDIYFDEGSPCRLRYGESIPFITDLQAGVFATSNSAVWKKIVDNLPDNVDFIHVEQPWLWPLALKIRELDKYRDVILINGTENVEWMLKKSIWESYGIQNDRIIEDIKKLEHQACRDADITLAVTQKDMEYFKPYINGLFVMAPNGVTPWIPSGKKLVEWSKRLPPGPWVLYVASAHPPNFTGLLKTMGDSLASIPPDGKLVVVGSVCEHVYRIMRETKMDSLNLSRLQLLFELDTSDLEAVRSLAWGFILPIGDGGGSNLKTAEALVAGVPILATRQAFRGFEEYEAGELVHICETPRAFQHGLYQVMQARERQFVSIEERKRRESLYWSNCLAGVPLKIKNLKHNKNHQA